MVRRAIFTVAVSWVLLGVMACAVYAAEPVWVAKEHTLNTGETKSATLKFSKLKIKWEDKTTTTKFEVECKKASGESELKGGSPGTDKLTTLEFEECTLLKGPTGCKLTTGSVGPEELPGWLSTLKGGLSQKVLDKMAEVQFSLKLKECENATYSKTWIFKGSLKAKTKNESGKVMLTLPTPAADGEMLETGGDEASLSGTGEMEEKGGGSLAAEEATPRWYTESNERFTTGVKTNILIEAASSTVLKIKPGGVEAEIVCAAIEGEGWIENPTSGKGKDEELVVYKKCTVPTPGKGCKVVKESIRQPDSSVLEYKGTTIVDEITIIPSLEGDLEEEGTTRFTVEGCENATLNKKWTLAGKSYLENGNLVGEPNNSSSTIKFTTSSGSSLYLHEFSSPYAEKGAATLTSEYLVLTEAGHKIQVG